MRGCVCDMQECILCPDREGAFKRTKSGDWVHVLCALYCPNVEFDNQETLSGIAVNAEQLGKTVCHRARL
jgi:NuA3 HAT complex component NTO1